MPMTWGPFDQFVRDGDSAVLSAALLAVHDSERSAFAADLDARIAAERGWWRGGHHRAGCYGLAVAACAPSATRAAAMLSHREMRRWSDISVEHFLRIARAREVSWLGDLGLRLAPRRPVDGLSAGDWRFVAALLAEGGAAPPITEGFVRGWLLAVHDGRLSETGERLRGLPFLDALLPSVFTLDGLGDMLAVGGFEDGRWEDTPPFPGAVAGLVAEGRLDREQILDATVDRLVRGDKPMHLKPFLVLHEALAPSPAEIRARAADHVRMLGTAPSSVAGFAQRALRTADEAGALELDTVLEAGAAALGRPEKGLVRAQLTWLKRVARRSPERAGEVLETVTIAFEHPALDVQERAAAMFGKPPPAVAGPLPVPALPPAAPSAAMPPRIGSAAELAEEVAALVHEPTAVRWERILAALVALPDDGFAAALGPVLDRFDDRYGRMAFLAAVIGSRAGREPDPVLRQRLLGVVRRSWTDAGGGMDRSLINTPSGLLTLRVAEVAVQLVRSPVPELLATPTHVDGSIDVAVLAERLARCEAAGREPWPLDLQQALIRVRHAEDGAEPVPAAGRLAAWLRGGGLPDPISTRYEQRSLDRDGTVVARRVVVNLESGRADGDRIPLEDALVVINRQPQPDYTVTTVFEPDILAMVLPRHREAVAAWALPELAGLADLDDRDGTLLPLLAEGSGPIGPAMTLGLAYGLGARHTRPRVAAVDAFLTLAARPEPFAAALGADLGDLCSDGTVKVGRVVAALSDAHQAGASAEVWEVLRAALPPLLVAAPRGLPDLLELATRAGAAVRARAEVRHLAETAGRGGGTRLTREARRLHQLLTG